MALCLVTAIATAFVGTSKLMALVIVCLMLVHIVTLVIVEIREEDWPPPTNPPA